MATTTEMWTPHLDRHIGDINPDMRKGMVNNQLEQLAENRSALKGSSALRKWGFALLLGGGLTVLTAGALAPYLVSISASAVANAFGAAANVGNVLWKVGAGLFGVGRVKGWVNEATRKKEVARSTSPLFRAQGAAPAPQPAH